MPRFFLAGSNISRGLAVITGSDAEHIRVLRMKLGDWITVCDESGTDHACRIIELKNGVCRAKVEQSVPCPAEAGVAVTVLAGLPKGDRADFIVQKCTEGGAKRILFFISERCVARPDARSLEKKVLRWQRIAEEAAKQSGRGIIPEIGVLEDLAQAIDTALKTDLPLFLYETGERVSLKDALSGAGDLGSCALITGPEGGFEPFEAQLAQAAGLKLCAMGPRILRCETAPVCALTCVMYETGNL